MKGLDTKMLEEITLGFVSGVFCERLPFPNCLFLPSFFPSFLPSLLGASVGAGAELGVFTVFSVLRGTVCATALLWYYHTTRVQLFLSVF